MFSGDLDISRYPEIAQRFRDCGDVRDRVIVDLSDATTVDSTFMTELLWFLRRHGKIERSAIVAHTNVARSLAMGGLDRKVRIVADYQRALDVLSLEA